MSINNDENNLQHLPAELSHYQRLVQFLDIVSEGLFHMDNSRTITIYTPDFYNQFGIDSTTLSLDEWFQLIHPMDREVLRQKIDNHMLIAESQDTHRKNEFRMRKTNGQYVWVEATVISKTNHCDGFYIGRHRDVSDQKLMESYLRQAAFYDNASGMSNRVKLLSDIEQAQKENIHTTLIYFQIDDIRSYLNQYGVEVAQHLIHHLISAIQAIPNHLTECYRVRSDDFAVLLTGEFTQDELMTMCHDIYAKYLCSMRNDGHLYGDHMSIGVYPNINADVDAEQIVNIASRTCQFAAEQKQSKVEIYSGKTGYKVDRFFFIERGLKEALNRRSLNVKFQPIVRSETGAVASFEALVRWKTQEFGEIYPDEFIPVAEKKGLIGELGYQVFAKACEFISQYNLNNQVTTRVNVNVSVLQLLDRSFPEQIRDIADKAGITTQSIVLELTETVILDGNKNALQQLRCLSEMGFQLALDDFGTGFSSINSFFDLPINQIKIDRTMACKTMENDDLNEYLEFIIRMCQHKSIAVVIEGIENSEMYKKFQRMGASYLQGYWLSKPLSLASASHYTLSSQGS
ncbi:EAL domain-containing protein [Vibrio porteresiae]|uniref:EAL domain-containing protein n=1 Tax=Vibrio porteresiae DSM 19223 TaxID=1123496 RepID=A0ABZ0QH50_9VIBR|nr:EAL domain-containing protein [Vibrio porteresiae]WPC75527.1 EAL domain-containing protein [Vibrio porteresiae DSM 19223]